MSMPVSEASVPALASPAFIPSGSPLRLAIVGCALGRSRYGSALAALPSVWRVSLLADADVRLAKVWSRELGGRIPVAETLEDVLANRERFDALLIASELWERAGHLRLALDAGVPVLCETPLTSALESTDALLTMRSSLLLPALPRRFDSAIAAFGEQIAAGAAGSVRQIRCDWNLPMNSLEDTVAQRDNDWNLLLQTVAIQTADLCRLWLGEAVSVSADVDFAALRGGRAEGRRVQEQTLANIIVAHERGQATHHIGRTRAIQTGERYAASGTEGSLELQVSAGASAAAASGPALRLQKVGTVAQRLPLPALPERTSVGGARMQALLKHFASCVQGQTAPLIRPEDARAALEIVHAAYASAFENAKISLPLRRSLDIAALLRPAQAQMRALSSE